MSLSPGARLRSAALAGIGFVVLSSCIIAGCGQSSVTQTGASSTTEAGAAKASGTESTGAHVLYESRGFNHALATAVPPQKPAPHPSMEQMQELINKRKEMQSSEQTVLIQYPRAGTYWLKGESYINKHLTPLVTVKTNKGSFVIEVEPKEAEITAGNFISLVQKHFYDHLTFHRYVPGFVIQGGDPKGDGTGGPGYMIPDEQTPLLHDTGAVAMAKSGPDTAGSQFYITLAPAHQLDHKYAVFGKVIKGMDVVEKLRKGDAMEKLTLSTIPATNTSSPAASDHSTPVQTTVTTTTMAVHPPQTPSPGAGVH